MTVADSISITDRRKPITRRGCVRICPWPMREVNDLAQGISEGKVQGCQSGKCYLLASLAYCFRYYRSTSLLRDVDMVLEAYIQRSSIDGKKNLPI